MNHWLVKTEPETYSFAQLVKDKKTDWTGVRNFQARRNLSAMALGDEVFIYHSVSEKAVVGVSKVSKTAFPDRTAEEGHWICVELQAGKSFQQPVTLQQAKATPELKDMVLVHNSRLSVQPVTTAEAAVLHQLGGLR